MGADSTDSAESGSNRSRHIDLDKSICNALCLCSHIVQAGTCTMKATWHDQPHPHHHQIGHAIHIDTHSDHFGHITKIHGMSIEVCKGETMRSNSLAQDTAARPAESAAPNNTWRASGL